jgi:hypothetical protein
MEHPVGHSAVGLSTVEDVADGCICEPPFMFFGIYFKTLLFATPETKSPFSCFAPKGRGRLGEEFGTLRLRRDLYASIVQSQIVIVNSNKRFFLALILRINCDIPFPNNVEAKGCRRVVFPDKKRKMQSDRLSKKMFSV